jgi:cytochrome b
LRGGGAGAVRIRYNNRCRAVAGGSDPTGSTMKEQSAITTNEPTQRGAVWDLPVRVFHWTLVLLILFSWWSGKEGGNVMQYHLWSGYAILTLGLFRLAWGFCGSSTARFAGFVRGPRDALAYARTLPERRAGAHLGHNPLGGWNVVLLLVCVLLQAATGLFSNDDIVTEGPLYKLVTKETSDFLTAIHYYNFYVLLALAAAHIAAVLFYLFYKADNLIKPMFTGHKLRPAGDAVQPARLASTWLATVLVAVAACAVYFIVRK